ncbi:MAG: recombinase family protein [Candidatus Jorgensenbacteria bacterium]|nr:recombinase family protein [Candidatus Jorgensenbacteria bacterium]
MRTSEDTKKAISLIAVYARVSTARQEEEGTIETQLSAVREFAKKNEYTIVKEYIDDGWSGDMLARPQLDQLRQDAKSKVWEAVLAYDPDRVARRYSYQELVMDELREGGIEVLFVTTPSPKNGEEKILHGVKGLFAEYERAKISERFRLGKMRKVREGNILLTEAPYGYRYIPKKDKVHGYLEINEGEARVVKMIFAWIVNEGLTIRGVVRRLQELSIKPRKSKRGVWNTSTLAHLLRNKTYIGQATYGKSYAVVPENPINTEKYRKMRKTSRRIRPEEEWTNIPTSAILEKDLFVRAQAQLKANFELSQRNRKNEYLLAGKAWCACGSRRTGEGPQHGKHLYYRCSNRITNFPLPQTCAEKGINARVADVLVWQRIAKLMSSPELLTKQVKRWFSKKHSEAQDSIADVTIMKKELLKMKEQEDRYTKAYGAGLFSIEKLKEYTVPLREKASSLENQIARVRVEGERGNGAELPSASEIGVFAKKAAEALQNLNFEARKAIVRNVIEKVVGTQSELQVYGYIPVSNINYVGFKTIHRNRWSAKRGEVNTV